MAPRAIVEVKIRVSSTLEEVIPDLKRNCDVLNSMKASYALKMQAAAVFEVHVEGGPADTTIDRLKKKIERIEKEIRGKLSEFASDQPDFSFELIPLQGPGQGYAPTEIEDEDTDTPSLGRDGHATRYYAILIASLRQPGPDETLHDVLRNRMSGGTGKTNGPVCGGSDRT